MIISKETLLSLLLASMVTTGCGAPKDQQDSAVNASSNASNLNIENLLVALNKAGVKEMTKEGIVKIPVTALNPIISAAKSSGIAAEIVGTDAGALKVKLLREMARPSLPQIRPDRFSPTGEKDEIEFTVGSGALESADSGRRS